jgi:PAS domain S-box-containing protein
LKSIIQERKSEEESILLHLKIISLAGLLISLFVLAYKQIFRPDIENLIADSATVLMFAGSLFSSLNKRINLSLNMVFFIPILVYLYYLAEFSNSEPPADTIYFTLWWCIGGIFTLAGFSKIDFRFALFVLAGLVTQVFHIAEAERTSLYFSLNQQWVFNPVVIFLFTSLVVTLFRMRSDSRVETLMDKQKTFERQTQDTFQSIKQPVAHINAERDQKGNIIRLEVEKVNHAFESQFKISMPEVQRQEVNYIFRYIFRNDTNWNDLFIIHPRQESEIYSPHLDRWFKIHLIWFNPSTCISIFLDITREMQNIKLLKETSARHLALLEAIPDIFFVIDSDGTYEDIVFKGQAELHMEAGEVIGSTIFDVGFPENMAIKIHECIRRAIKNDSIETIEYSLEVNNVMLLFEMRLARLNDNAVVSIARDITRRKMAEFELERAKIKAEEAVALKSRFLANLSHDIRTPMGIIIGLSKLLAEPGLSETEREDFIQDISKQGQQLFRMIDNTIHLSKIETNTLEMNFAWCNIHQLLREIYNQYYPMLPERSHLQLKMVTGLMHEEAGFETDPVLLKEIIQELVDNAIKFTQEGIIQFGYRHKSANSVEFFVEDTGPGIPDSEKENIFLRFYVIEKDRQAQKSGPGIGLPVAQHFVALLGGDLMMESQAGKGSRFWFELPLLNSRGFMRVVS